MTTGSEQLSVANLSKHQPQLPPDPQPSGYGGSVKKAEDSELCGQCCSSTSTRPSLYCIQTMFLWQSPRRLKEDQVQGQSELKPPTTNNPGC